MVAVLVEVPLPAPVGFIHERYLLLKLTGFPKRGARLQRRLQSFMGLLEFVYSGTSVPRKA